MTKLFFLCPGEFFCGIRGIFGDVSLLSTWIMPSFEETALINIYLNNQIILQYSLKEGIYSMSMSFVIAH